MIEISIVQPITWIERDVPFSIGWYLYTVLKWNIIYIYQDATYSTDIIRNIGFITSLIISQDIRSILARYSLKHVKHPKILSTPLYLHIVAHHIPDHKFWLHWYECHTKHIWTIFQNGTQCMHWTYCSITMTLYFYIGCCCLWSVILLVSNFSVSNRMQNHRVLNSRSKIT